MNNKKEDSYVYPPDADTDADADIDSSDREHVSDGRYHAKEYQQFLIWQTRSLVRASTNLLRRSFFAYTLVTE